MTPTDVLQCIQKYGLFSNGSAVEHAQDNTTKTTFDADQLQQLSQLYQQNVQNLIDQNAGDT